jgi:tetratricopeptide (TPR) repeat protein
MNKKLSFLLLLAGFFVVTAFVVIRYNTKSGTYAKTYPLLERKGALAGLPEWASIKAKGETLYTNINNHPDDIPTAIQLAGLYIQEARITGNYNYYDGAAMKYIDHVLALKPGHFEALILKSIIQLSQHHFTEALETAGTAQKTNPYNAFVYGIMVDGNVEMGNYAEAVEASDKMMSIRPDIRSYSRVSYLREIHGDLPGAIEAMKMAVDAGARGDEGTEWARVQLGRLYELSGETRTAEMHYLIALRERPSYGQAFAGLGSIALGKEDFPAAIKYFEQANANMNDYGVREQLAEAHMLAGNKDKAAALLDNIEEELLKGASEGENGANHHADKELAYVYLLKGSYDKAVKHAVAEYNRRPDNIEVNEAVAWTLFKSGDTKKAIPYLEKALSTNSKNPVLLTRAGIIFSKDGEQAKAQKMLTEAMKNNPNINPLLKREAGSLVSK